MHKVITLLSAVALSLGAFAEITTIPLVKGENIVSPAKVIAVKAASATASGTITIKEILDVATKQTSSVSVTNIAPKDVVTLVGKAYVNQTKVYEGSGDTAWNKWTSVVTNIADSVTNIVTYKCAQWHDGSTTNSLVYTNYNCRVDISEIVRPGLVTNVTSRSIVTWKHTPYTNDLYSGTMSSGKLSAITNIVLLGGVIDVGGTAITNGNAYIVLEK